MYLVGCYGGKIGRDRCDRGSVRERCRKCMGKNIITQVV